MTSDAGIRLTAEYCERPGSREFEDTPHWQDLARHQPIIRDVRRAIAVWIHEHGEEWQRTHE